MSKVEIKDFAEAAVDFNRKAVQNFTDVTTKTWKDMVSFGDAAVEAQAELIRTYSIAPSVTDALISASKAQYGMVKAAANWDSFTKIFAR
jgi:hypothetical protein